MSGLRRRVLRALAPMLAVAAFGGWAAQTSAAEGEPNCSIAPNPVACENALPGTPAASWQVEKIGDPSIQGYATQMSVNPGETETFKIKTPSSAYHIDILRLGYYRGDGARMIASGLKPSATLPQTQPECIHQPSTGLVDCGNWAPSASWTVPTTAVSGVYIAHLVRDDEPEKSSSEKSSQIIFVVRNDASHSKILLQTSDATWEAYNAYGGNSLYTCTVECPTGSPKAYKGADSVSYNRPFDGALVTDNGASYLYYAEYQMIRWLERNGYDVAYTTSGQVAQNGTLLKNHQVFMSSGHDEYWSASQRANVEAAREAGVNLAFFSANELFWKTRWGNSADGTNTPYRTLTAYKETHFEGPVDPGDPPVWTGAWRDPRGGPGSDGGKAENALSGQQFEVNSGTGEITVPSIYSRLRLWRNTAVAALSPGQTLTLAPDVGTLGYEWDEDVDNGFRPAGEWDLSSTTMSGVQAFIDYGSTLTGNATATHHLTLYRAPSGALVFGAGTVQWSWGLDNTNAWNQGATDPEHPPVDPNMQQFSVNLLAEMGAQPETLQANLAGASQSSDTAPPSSTVTSPGSGETVQDGSRTTITGTATDAGGGVVAGVEVSTDNGATWHPATLGGPAEASATWSYTWATHGYPQTTIKSRAVDDSSNLESPSAGVQVKVACPCSIWGNSVTPPTPDSGDGHSVELGVKFTTETFGVITGIRYYKSAANTGAHSGSLWSSSGQRLAAASFSGETESGWQQVTFSTPVDVFPGQTYVASYFTPTGHYAASSNYFYTPPATGGNALNAPPLHALPANAPPNGATYGSLNGVFAYGSASTFPANSFSGSNYWVDPVFIPVPAPSQVTGVTAKAGYQSATVSWTAAGGGPTTEYKITPFIGGAAQTPNTITGTPPATSVTINGLTGGTTYTFQVTAINPIGSAPASAASNAVTPVANSAPTAPTSVTAAAATSRAVVNWTEPTSNGGSPITSYTVTPFIGPTAQPSVEVPAGATSDVVKNLINGTAYTFTVTANNAIGTSPASTPTAAVVPQDTIFDFATPTTIDSGDASATNVGVKFTSELAGTITGIRFYKAPANTGTHVGSLWTAAGTLLAQATFTNESANGWQQVNFSTPVQITPNTTYVASYLAPKGHYSNTTSAFATTGFANAPLSALANSTSPNGLYLYSTKSGFPTSTFKSTNYWVDVDFEPTPVPGQVTNVSATAGNATATISWSAPSNGGPVAKYTVTPYIGNEAQTPTTVTGTPPATGVTLNGLTDGLEYTFVVRASNANGSGPESERSNVVTPAAATPPGVPGNVSALGATEQALVSWSEPSSNGGSPITGYKITPFIGASAQKPVEVAGNATSATIPGLTDGTAYTFSVAAVNGVGTGSPATSNAATPQNTILDFATPATIDSGATGSTEVGVKFTAELAGQITAIRFYKAPANTGSHIVSLWTSGGTQLASATASSESASGWQQVNFATPVAIAANTTYVAAYLAPKGHYSDNAGGFAFSGITNGPLTALANSTSANGVFANSATSTFPSSTSGATNYWVDVAYEATPLPGQVTGVSATAGNASANVTWSAPSTGGPPATYTVTPFIGSSPQTPTIVTGTPPATGVTVKGLTNGTAYTFTVQAANANGSGPVSEPSSPVVPIAAPGAPTGVTASGGNHSATVTWTAPASNGGSAITSYTVTPFIGSEAQTATVVAGSPPATGVTVTGLTNGSSYTFKVTATNAAGTGPASEASAPVTPATTPSAPPTPAATAGNASAIVTWSAPANGGSPITSYTVTPFIGSEAQTPTTITGSPPVTSATITGLTNGTSYTFKVTATNAVGAGPSSEASNVVVPAAPQVPGAPTAVTATAGNASAVVKWTAPSSGGSQISSYTVTPFIGSEAQTPTTITGSPPATSATISGLTNGTAYTFSVTATNSIGSGSPSAPSASVTPFTTPSAPSGTSATAGNTTAAVSWTAPANNGSTITSYTITPFVGSEAKTPTTISGSPPATNATVTGLSNGTTYTFKVTATNAAGSGPASAASNAVTPTAVTAPSAPTAVVASPATRQALVSWSEPASNGGSAISGYTVTPFLAGVAQTPVEVAAGSNSTTIKGLANGSAYTFTVTAFNAVGVGPASSPSAAITPQTTIFDFATPATIDAADAHSAVLGVKFSSEVAGNVTGIRFYKASTNTGTHIGSLWSASGTLLASLTFSGEAGSGWQQALFSSPVPINANTTYVASYLAPKGHYSATSSQFVSIGVTNPPVQALANPVSANGVYAYSATNAFPTSTFKSTNYWVDVLFSS